MSFFAPMLYRARLDTPMRMRIESSMFVRGKKMDRDEKDKGNSFYLLTLKSRYTLPMVRLQEQEAPVFQREPCSEQKA